MAGITSLTIKFGDMDARRMRLVANHMIRTEWASDQLREEFAEIGNKLGEYIRLDNVTSDHIEEIQERLLDYLTVIGVSWRATIREMDDFVAGWWESDGAFHCYDPFAGFDPSLKEGVPVFQHIYQPEDVVEHLINEHGYSEKSFYYLARNGQTAVQDHEGQHGSFSLEEISHVHRDSPEIEDEDLFLSEEPKEEKMSVTVQRNVPGEVQESSFMNATLEHYSKYYIAVSIATKVDVPEVILDQGHNAIADYIEATLKDVAYSHPELSFEVQVGIDGR